MKGVVVSDGDEEEEEDACVMCRGMRASQRAWAMGLLLIVIVDETC